METFSFNPPIDLSEEGNCLLAVTTFEATNSVFDMTNENETFSITTPGNRITKGAGSTIGTLNILIDVISEKRY